MNPDQLALWQRIEAHALDDPKSARPFSLRLAAENGWRPGFTRRAIEEYRRFAFLAAAAGHPVSPSEAIDQVWHLHLLYTRDYWGEFCPKILGMALHHGPARGGVSEADKLADWYGRTRASYREFFGEPPAEFWPERPVHPQTVRVDVTRNWVVPKPRVFEWLGRKFSRRTVPVAASPESGIRMEVPAPIPAAVATSRVGTAVTTLALASVAVPQRALAAATRDTWPFDLRGPEFLGFYFLFATVLFGVALGLRWWLRKPANFIPGDDLNGYELAYLGGGEKRVFEAAVAGCVHRQLVQLADGKLKRTEAPMPGGLPLVERAVVEAARAEGTGLHGVRGQTDAALRELRAGLAERGLAVGGAEVFPAQIVPFGVAAIVPLVGWIKVVIGLDRNRPVAFLVMLSIAASIGALVYLNPPRITRRGAAVLADVLNKNRRLMRLEPALLAGDQGAMWVPMAVGLWGLDALEGTSLELMRRDFTAAQNRSGDGGFATSTCSSDSGGGSSCGGGGGCGGCGGGGD